MLLFALGNEGLGNVLYDTELLRGGKAPMPSHGRLISPLLVLGWQALLRLGKTGRHIGRSQ